MITFRYQGSATQCKMEKNFQLTVWLFFVAAISTETLKPLQNDEWSCTFVSDLCDWTVPYTKANVSAGPLTDLGWRIYSPNAGDHLEADFVKDSDNTESDKVTSTNSAPMEEFSTRNTPEVLTPARESPGNDTQPSNGQLTTKTEKVKEDKPPKERLSDTTTPGAPLQAGKLGSPGNDTQVNPDQTTTTSKSKVIARKVDDSPKFAYLESLSQLISELSSPPMHLTHNERSEGLLLSFTYFTFNAASLTVYLVRNNTYSIAWGYSTPKMLAGGRQKEEGDLQPVWVTITQCLSQRIVRGEEGNASETRLSFIGQVLPNSSIGLRNVKVMINPECAPTKEEPEILQNAATAVKNKNEVEPNAAWKFLVIVSLALCFGGLFLAALIIVFGGLTKKDKSTAQATTGQQNYKNAAFSFKYQRLEV